MKGHKREDWFGQLLEEHKKTPEFLVEQKILELTEKIVQRMAELSISRSVLADRLKVSKAYITKLLRGDVNFTLKSLTALSMALEADFAIDFFPKGASLQVLRCYDNSTGEVIVKTQTVIKQPMSQCDQVYSPDEYVETESEIQGAAIHVNSNVA